MLTVESLGLEPGGGGGEDGFTQRESDKCCS